MPLPSVSATTFATASTTVFEQKPIDAGLDRIEPPPGGEFRWLSTGVSAAMVEDGNLSLATEEKDELGRIPPQQAALAMREARVG